jgi:CRP-like cAMP-binding protein
MVQVIVSPYSAEAMEPSVVIRIGWTALQRLMDESHAWERFVRQALERLNIRKEERERELLLLSAAERYERFKKRFPGLPNRIPQYHIASYLGISSVSFSRMLRKR